MNPEVFDIALFSSVIYYIKFDHYFNVKYKSG